MRISDWSSDVCSSDLMKHVPGARSIHVGCSPGAAFPHSRGTRAGADMESWHGTTILGVRKNGKVVAAGDGQVSLGQTVIKIGRASCRESECQYVSISVVAVPFK